MFHKIKVFVDALGNVKVGDLGLATTLRGEGVALPSRGVMAASSLLLEALTPDASLDSLTRGVGTAMYRAPEVVFAAQVAGAPAYGRAAKPAASDDRWRTLVVA